MSKHYRANRIGRPGTFLILLSMITLSLALSGCGDSSGLSYSITGAVVSGGTPIAGVTLTLSNGPSSGVSVTDANGNYSFGGLQSGTYVITPTLAGYTFVPTSRPAYLYGNNADGFNFNASRGISVSTSSHTLYAKSDGTAWAWGKNDKGQLGNNSTADSNIPVPVSVLTNVRAVAAGNAHSLALKSDGTVWSWGSNSNGQLGDGTLIDRLEPVPVSQASGLTNVTAIAAGFNFSAALRNDGVIFTWGSNNSGQLGNNTTIDSSTPVAIIGGISAIAAGTDHTAAMTTSGGLFTWGNNSKGQLGNASTVNSSVPIPAGAGLLTPVLAISAGNQFTIALTSNYLSSWLWAWGSNSNGQLGNGTHTDTTFPVQVGNLAGMTAIAVGQNHAISLRADGTVWVWGDNTQGQLGIGAPSAGSTTPIQVPSLSAVQGVTAGYQDSFASTTVGSVYAWGDNAFGQLGDGTNLDQPSPELITLP